MANRRENRPSIVQWDLLRRIWTRNSRNDTAVQRYFDTFLKSHRNYQFTVAKVYYGLYQLGVTCEQYDAVKDELHRKTGNSLPGINCTELMTNGGDVRKKSFRNEHEYRAYQSSFVQANNKRIVQETRDATKVHFERAEKLFKEAVGKLIVSFDLEVYEYDSEKVLEIGYIVVRLGTETPEVTEKCHFIIEENLEYKNKDFVSDNRDGFRFGESKTVPQKEAVENFRQAVQDSAFLVAHAARCDEAYLKNIGVDLAEFKKEIMDTQQVQQHKEFEAAGSVGDRVYLRSLGKLLENCSVHYNEADLHNAACDAYYTMKVFLRQMGQSAAVVNSLS